MAFTLQQRVNVSKGATITDAVLFTEKIDAAIKMYAGQLKKGDLVASSLPLYSTFNPSASQINEWCNKALDSDSMSVRMTPSVISDPDMETNGINSTDSVINAAVQWNIAAYAAKL